MVEDGQREQNDVRQYQTERHIRVHGSFRSVVHAGKKGLRKFTEPKNKRTKWQHQVKGITSRSDSTGRSFSRDSLRCATG